MTESCSVKEIIRDDETYNHRIQALLDKFGEVFSGLRSLSDFHYLHCIRKTGDTWLVLAEPSLLI